MDCMCHIFLYFYLVSTLHQASGSEFINYEILGDFTEHPGHLKPFGAGQGVDIDEITGVPDPVTFYQQYVLPDKPVKMKKAVVDHPAFTKWTDRYFLKLNIPASTVVDVEYHKKEIRGLPVKSANFKVFVTTHRKSKLYMIGSVPDFLRKDLRLQHCLQCEDMVNKMIDAAIMWFSGGGTSSVVHSDSYHNLNCVYRGSKHFVLVNPHKYEHLAHIDRPEGGYSSVDVDSVDMKKYPGLAQIEYIHAHIDAGDCLYIPYAWIHQVRSFNSNIATNIWWQGLQDFDLDTCNKTYDESFTLENLPVREDNIGTAFMQQVTSELRKAPGNQMTGEEIVNLIIPEINYYYGDDFFKKEIDDLKVIGGNIIGYFDLDQDGVVTMDEMLYNSEEKFMGLRDELQSLGDVLNKLDLKLKLGDEPRDAAGQLLSNRDEL